MNKHSFFFVRKHMQDICLQCTDLMMPVVAASANTPLSAGVNRLSLLSALQSAGYKLRGACRRVPQ